jgi:hypothetical protein
MAIDVLEYNRLVIPNYNANYANLANAITLANVTYYQPSYNTANASAYSNTAFYTINQAIVPTLNTNPLKQNTYGIFAACGLYSTPWCCCYWATIPDLPAGSVTGNLTVCDPSGNYRCGVCCGWTVPAGVTYARFQIWGAGAGSHNMCCCGGGMWGGSGAYASVILPVTPGNVYTICSGCAYCCYMQSAGPTVGAGCASYVVGPGLYNFCAEGGEPNPYCGLQRAQGLDGQTATFDGRCMIMNASTRGNKIGKGTTYGWCMCGGGGFCWGTGCSGNDALPYTTSIKSFYGSVTNPTKACHYVIGANGMFNSINQTTSYTEGCKYLTHPPIVNFCCATCSVYMNAGLTCCGASINAVNGYFQLPGRGGGPSSVAGGCDNCGGGIGTMGLVCVTWTCIP